MLHSVWKTRVVYFKGKKKKQEGGGVDIARGATCPMPPLVAAWPRLAQEPSAHHTRTPGLGDGVLSPVLQPLEPPGMQGKAEALLQHKQTAQDRLRFEQKALSEIVPPLHQTGCQPFPGLVPSPAA